MPTFPPLLRKIELSGLVEVAHLELELPPLLPPIHTPPTAQHPPVRLTPLANEEVAADEEKRALEIVVEAWVMLKSVEVA